MPTTKTRRPRPTYCKFFATDREATQWMEMKNRACKLAGNDREIYAQVDGPEDNFAVVDLDTALEMNIGYKINY